MPPRSAVRIPAASVLPIAVSMSSASSFSPSAWRNNRAADAIVATGLARSCPAMSGADPCTGSKRPPRPPMLARDRIRGFVVRCPRPKTPAGTNRSASRKQKRLRHWPRPRARQRRHPLGKPAHSSRQLIGVAQQRVLFLSGCLEIRSRRSQVLFQKLLFDFPHLQLRSQALLLTLTYLQFAFQLAQGLFSPIQFIVA